MSDKDPKVTPDKKKYPGPVLRRPEDDKDVLTSVTNNILQKIAANDRRLLSLLRRRPEDDKDVLTLMERVADDDRLVLSLLEQAPEAFMEVAPAILKHHELILSMLPRRLAPGDSAAEQPAAKAS